ncbi:MULTISPECIES: NAD-dependent epimerase/dehydratase family protein [Aeromicrobium]|uniref:NAD-dependent epimerase/dehydratase family protein n=1 Tax=Aeromicrobium TaxID=2040 RepID=UPI0025809BB2|nr:MULTISPECIES: NAD-dependent epimerase/dehydratase family protein [Aeromicrobium]
MAGVVLVTGAATPGVALAARRIAEAGDARVVAVDTTLPTDDLGSVKFVRADIRTPVISKVLAVEDVDTVVHMDLAPMRSRGGGSATKEINVIGTMQVLAACQRSDTVQRVVLASSAAVYGASPRDPAVFTESATARGGTKSGFAKDIVEVEGYTRGFARRRPDVTVTTLRMAQWLSPHFPTVLGSYFANPVLPVPMGFDARLQLLHPQDALEVISMAALSDRPGTFNVAGDGILMLTQAARIMGKPTIPLPPLGFGSVLRRMVHYMGSDVSPGVHRLLTYGRVLDTTALREIFGYSPRHTTRETFEWYAEAARPGLLHSWGITG